MKFLMAFSIFIFTNFSFAQKIYLLHSFPEKNIKPVFSDKTYGEKIAEYFFDTFSMHDKSGVELVLIEDASAVDLHRALTDSQSKAVFWIGHGNRSQNSALNSSLIDKDGNDISFVLSKISSHIEYLAIIGCFSDKIRFSLDKKFKGSFFAPKGKDTNLDGLKKAFVKSAGILTKSNFHSSRLREKYTKEGGHKWVRFIRDFNYLGVPDKLFIENPRSNKRTNTHTTNKSHRIQIKLENMENLPQEFFPAGISINSKFVGFAIGQELNSGIQVIAPTEVSEIKNLVLRFRKKVEPSKIEVHLKNHDSGSEIKGKTLKRNSPSKRMTVFLQK